MRNLKSGLAALAVSAAAIGVVAPAASAGVVDYPSTANFSIPDGTDNGGLPSQVFVPEGRTPVTKVELVSVAPSYPSGGGLGFQMFLAKPGQANGTSLFTSNTCSNIPNDTAFTLTDSSTTDADTANCATLEHGVLKPETPLSAFNGPAAGVWTVGVRDLSIIVGSGHWNGWTLRLTHAAPTLSASALKQKLGKTLYATVTPDADGTVTPSGDGTGAPVAVVANKPATIPFSLAGKAKKKIKKKGKGTANVTFTLADQTNGTATATAAVKVKK